jgi:hypothetical protein
MGTIKREWSSFFFFKHMHTTYSSTWKNINWVHGSLSHSTAQKGVNWRTLGSLRPHCPSTKNMVLTLKKCAIKHKHIAASATHAGPVDRSYRLEGRSERLVCPLPPNPMNICLGGTVVLSQHRQASQNTFKIRWNNKRITPIKIS